MDVICNSGSFPILSSSSSLTGKVSEVLPLLHLTYSPFFLSLSLLFSPFSAILYPFFLQLFLELPL